MTQCSHINKQFYNSKGVLEDLTCTLEEGHDGDHSATIQVKLLSPQQNEKGEIVESLPHNVAWSDAAGKKL